MVDRPTHVQPNFGGGHSDKASIAQALASLPSNMKALNLSNGHRANGNPNGNGAPRNSNPPPLTNGNGNGNGHGKPNQNQQPAQRIPSEEDFPSLAGSGSTGIARSNSSLSVITSNGGKTAAQILKSSPPSASSPAGSANASANKFRAGAAGGKEKERSVPPRSGESSASEKTTTTTDVESLKSAGTSATDQLTRPTSPEDAAADVPKPLPSTIEVPPIVA